MGISKIRGRRIDAKTVGLLLDTYERGLPIFRNQPYSFRGDLGMRACRVSQAVGLNSTFPGALAPK